MTRIYYAGIDATTTENEYTMTEISAADHGEEWNGDTLGYVQNMDLDSDYTVGSDADLGNVHQNFGGLDPIPGSIVVLLQDDAPVLVYWASEITASWLTGPAYDQDTFENMVSDFLADHNTDEYEDDPLILDGAPQIYDGDTWVQSAHDSGHAYTLVGDQEGNIRIIPE